MAGIVILYHWPQWQDMAAATIIKPLEAQIVMIHNVATVAGTRAMVAVPAAQPIIDMAVLVLQATLVKAATRTTAAQQAEAAEHIQAAVIQVHTELAQAAALTCTVKDQTELEIILLGQAGPQVPQVGVVWVDQGAVWERTEKIRGVAQAIMAQPAAIMEVVAEHLVLVGQAGLAA
jgi:hypothetical protein